MTSGFREQGTRRPKRSGFGTVVRLAGLLLLSPSPRRAMDMPGIFTLGVRTSASVHVRPDDQVELGPFADSCLRGEACKYCTAETDALVCRDRCVRACESNCAQSDCSSLCLDCVRAVHAALPDARGKLLLSENRPAFQSSTHGSGQASLAVDGNTDGDYHHGSCTHTDANAALPAWWQVDLDNTATIDEVRIWNRGDCCSERLRDFEVRLCADRECAESKSCGGVTSSAVEPSAMFTAACGQSTARSVRLIVNNTCTLCEVQVYGTKGHVLHLVANGKVSGASNAVCTTGGCKART
jgi:hypothetical protein